MKRGDLDLGYERGLPANLEAERYVLGSITKDPGCFPLLLEFLTGDEFSLEANRRIFRAMRALYQSGTAVDRVTVATLLMEERKLESIGGSGYLLDLEDGLPRLHNVDAYARIVLEKYKQRQAIIALQNGIDQIYEGASSESVDSIVQTLHEVRERSTESRRGLRTAEQIITAVGPDELAAAKFGIRTGFRQLDELICGLREGQLAIVGGRPACGKTALAMDIADHVSRGSQQKRVALWSLEMSAEELIHRQMCKHAGMSQTAVRNGAAQFHDLNRSLTHLAENTRLLIDDTPRATVESIRSVLQKQQSNEEPIELAIIDYLGLMEALGRYEKRHEAITEITRGLKLLAKEFRLPIVVLCQFSRNMESEKRRPTMADFRDSGSIEQDADLLVGLYRNLTEDLTEMILLKQRTGPLSTVRLKFDGRLCSFSEI